MRHICICLLCCFAIPAFGQQDTPRAEVFGGYSYLHIDTQGVTGTTIDTACNNLLGHGTCPPGSFQVHQNFNGWNASVQVNVTRLFGIKADFSGHYGTPVTFSSQIQSLLSQAGITGLPPNAKSYSYLFGPVVSQSAGRYRPFAHALFGANSVSTNLSGVTIGGLGIPGLTLTDTAFAMAFGGGVDVKLTDHLSLRAGQADYLFTKHDFSGGIQGIATHQNNFRASVGAVFQFGGRREAQPTQSRQPTHNAVSAVALPIPVLGMYVAASANDTGARITEIAPNSTAAFAGLHPGDIINSVNGVQVKTPADLMSALSAGAPGAKVRITYMIRGEWQAKATVLLGNR